MQSPQAQGWAHYLTVRQRHDLKPPQSALQPAPWWPWAAQRLGHAARQPEFCGLA